MVLYNNRKDVNYYEVSVFDKEWNKVPFSTGSDNIVKVSYLQRKPIKVYIRKKDVGKDMYVCSRSRSIVEGDKQTFLASRICSKIK